jgi:2-methylcitrate dehydratase
MQRIDFRHGGPEYDAKYPDGLPTLLKIEHAQLGTLSSGLVMYPEGHARNKSGNLDSLLKAKFVRLAALGVSDPETLWKRISNLHEKSAGEVAALYSFEIQGV